MSVKWNVAGTMASKRSGGFDVDYKELFLRPQAPKNDGESATYTVRFLEDPTPVLIYWGKKRDPKTKKTYDCPFPDAEFNKRPSRVGFATVTEDGDIVESSSCPWYKAQFTRQLRYYVNILDRETNKVRIFDCPATVLEKVATLVEGRAKKNKAFDPSSWTKSTDFEITVKRTSAQGGVDYTVSGEWDEMTKLSDADMEVIKALPYNKEAKKTEDMKLHPLEHWVAPTPLKTSNDKEVAADDSVEDLARANKASKISDDLFGGGEELVSDEVDLGDLAKDYL